MKLRRLIAGTIAVTMVAGSSITVFADGSSGSATGTGDSTGHLDKEVLTVTLPTEGDALNSTLNYCVDPERIVDLAGSLKDGTSVTENADGVYFKNKDGSYSSSSDEIPFEGKNSVAVDVSVAAEVTSVDTDIALVASDDELTNATTPALLMNLTVGDDVKAITSTGTAAKAKLDGVADNFEAKLEDGAYKYVAKADAAGWNSTTVKLTGKTNKVDVPDAMTAPQITLTWTIAKHVDAPTYTEETCHGNWSAGVLWLAKDSSTGFSSSSLTVEVSEDGSNYSTVATDKYTVDENNWISMPWASITETLGAEPSGTYYVRITDGSVRYTTTY